MGIFYYVKQRKLPSKTTLNYLNSIISNKNIYRVLFDAISESKTIPASKTISSEYWYKVNRDYYETMGLANISKIRNILEEAKPTNESQRRVLDVYQKFLNQNATERIYYNDPVNPDEL